MYTLIIFTFFAVVLIIVAFIIGRYFSTTVHKARTINIKNKERKFGALNDYRGVILDGEWCFFSPSAIAKASETALKNREDIPKNL